MRKPGDVPRRLSALDYYKILVSVLMVGLGILILYRSVLRGLNIMPVIVGLSFIGFGAYRIKFIINYFKQRGGKK